MLDEFTGKPGLRFLEVGSFEGRSAVWTLQNILTSTSSSLVCVDTFEGGDDLADLDLSRLQQTFKDNVAPFRSRVRLIVGQSGAVLRRLAGPFDFIYIDGSHVAQDALEDAVLAWRLLRSGGIMAFDDYVWCGPPDPRLSPRIAIDAFIATRRPGSFKVLSEGIQLFVRKLDADGEDQTAPGFWQRLQRWLQERTP